MASRLRPLRSRSYSGGSSGIRPASNYRLGQFYPRSEARQPYPRHQRVFFAFTSIPFNVTIPAAEGISGVMIIKETGGSSNQITIKVEDGVHTVSQTIERLSQITSSTADGCVMVLSDEISNWMIISRVGT